MNTGGLLREDTALGITVVGRLGDVPAAQHGYFTRAQAAAVGVPDCDLTRSVQRGLIERVGHGVYRVVGAGHDPLADLRVAWLRLAPARGPRERVTQPTVWVTRGSAARVHGLGVFAGPGHTFASSRRIQAGGRVVVHRRVGGVLRADWEVKDGFAVTTVACTAADLLAARTDGGHLGRFLDDALHVGAVTMDQLADRLALSHDDIEALIAQAAQHPVPASHG